MIFKKKKKGIIKWNFIGSLEHDRNVSQDERN